MAKRNMAKRNPADVPAETAPTARATGLTLAEWRAQQQHGEPKVLPNSLLAVRLRRCRLMDLVVQGNVPQTLTALAESVNGRTFTIKDAAELLPLINVTVKACQLEPPVADVADDTHISLDEIPVEDRFYIFAWAIAGTQAVQPFLGEPARSLESAPTSPGV